MRRALPAALFGSIEVIAMMRIITGTARGMRLLSLPGNTTRPTTEIAKEGIFSAIQFEVMGMRVLDLFAGTGQLGLEALSRGARSAVFVDNDKRAAQLIEKNAERTRLSDKSRVLCTDAFAFMKSAKEPFSLIFVDPPYRETILPKVTEKILEYSLLAERGILVLESTSAGLLPKNMTELFGTVKHYKYGKTHCLLLRREPEDAK